ncbi:MAG: enoyl-CoA hydratase/isomerase family protein [SAR324 cluster bacterium]|nr:enoyl-CoA hydratase/isomerase family protein [SAR324 cluster bacterium]
MIRIERDGPVTALILNRPERRNALNEEMIRGLRDGVLAAQADAACRCLVIKGAGEHFCAGRDISGKVGGKTLEDTLAFDDLYTGLFEALRTMSKPSVAIVRGFAVAGGFTLAMGCDFVLAEQNAQFGALEMRGGFPAAVNTALLTHLTTPRMALEFLLSADTFPAVRLCEAGLINRLAADEQALHEIEREFVAGLVALEPVAVKLTKETQRATAALPMGEALLMAKQLNSLLAASGQIDKGVKRFAESRKKR